MTLPVNPAGVMNYNTPVAGGQSAPPQAKKDRLPWGQIATTAVVGGAIAVRNHVAYLDQLNYLNKLKGLNLDDPNDVKQITNSLPNWAKRFIQIMDESPEGFIREQKKMLEKWDLDNTAKHIGKNIGWAALGAGATALIYGGIRTLVNHHKQPQTTPTPTPTA